MLQGDAIREITLEGPGAGGIETASAVVADLVSIVGTSGTGFLQGDPVWRELDRMPPGELASPWYLRLRVEDRAGVLAQLAHELAAEGVSVARLVQQPVDGDAVLHVVTHEAPAGRVEAALASIRSLAESRGEASALPVVSERGHRRIPLTRNPLEELDDRQALIDRFRDRLPVSEPRRSCRSARARHRCSAPIV